MQHSGESINANDPEFITWVSAEYEAGYEARFAGASESLTPLIAGRRDGRVPTWSYQSLTSNG